MAFVIANAYDSFLLPWKKKTSLTNCRKRCIVKTEDNIFEFIQFTNRKNSSTWKSHDRRAAHKTVFNDNNDVHWSNKFRGRNITSYDSVETALLQLTLSLDEINRTVKIREKKFIEFAYKS